VPHSRKRRHHGIPNYNIAPADTQLVIAAARAGSYLHLLRMPNVFPVDLQNALLEVGIESKTCHHPAMENPGDQFLKTPLLNRAEYIRVPMVKSIWGGIH
jgi:hypothetical protein